MPLVPPLVMGVDLERVGAALLHHEPVPVALVLLGVRQLPVADHVDVGGELLVAVGAPPGPIGAVGLHVVPEEGGLTRLAAHVADGRLQAAWRHVALVRLPLVLLEALGGNSIGFVDQLKLISITKPHQNPIYQQQKTRYLGKYLDGKIIIMCQEKSGWI